MNVFETQAALQCSVFVFYIKPHLDLATKCGLGCENQLVSVKSRHTCGEIFKL